MVSTSPPWTQTDAEYVVLDSFLLLFCKRLVGEFCTRDGEFSHQPKPGHGDDCDTITKRWSSCCTNRCQRNTRLSHELGITSLKFVERVFVLEKYDHGEVLGSRLDTGCELPESCFPNRAVAFNNDAFTRGAAEAESDTSDRWQDRIGIGLIEIRFARR